jgi:hypothetical protein
VGVCLSVCDGISDFAIEKEYDFRLDGNRIDFECGKLELSGLFEK